MATSAVRPESSSRIHAGYPRITGAVRQTWTSALAQWEPRIEVDDVRPTADENDDGLVRIMISYRVRATNDRRNLVYPFYVIPHDAE